MKAEVQKAEKSLWMPIAIGAAIPTLFFVFRATAAGALVVFLVLCICFRWHRSRRALQLAYVVFGAAILIPVDVYIPGFNGPLWGSKHSGLRFVHVVHGKPMIQRCLDRYGEFVEDGCAVGLYDTRLRLVWD